MKHIIQGRERAARFILALALSIGSLMALGTGVSPAQADKRPFTQADSIEMTSIADPDYWHHNQSAGRVGHYSPDGTKLVVTLRKGNLAEGTTEYSMLLYRTAELVQDPLPDPSNVLSMASVTNQEIFAALRWLGDNRTVLFLGEKPGEARQVFSFDVESGALQQRTHAATDVLSYTASDNGARILYVAQESAKSVWNDDTRRNGLVVTDEHLANLVAGRVLPMPNQGALYLESDPAGDPRHIEPEDRLNASFAPLISPDGRLALVRVFAPRLPSYWYEYTDPILKSAFPVEPLKPGEMSNITQFVIVDLDTGEVRSRVDAPQPYTVGGVEAKWAPDGGSVLITLLYLPVKGVSGEERQRRLSGPFTAEVDVATGQARPLAPESLLETSRIERWDPASQTVVLARQVLGGGGERAHFRKQGDGWQQVESAPDGPGLPELKLEEGLNQPPRIVMVDQGSGTTRELLDLNPQFGDLTLAHQEEIAWRTTDGSPNGSPHSNLVRGALYYPTHYEQGQRYPLVIQTHGYKSDMFAADGVFFTANAAQALANAGIMVLQAWDFPEENNEALWQEWLANNVSNVGLHQFEQAVYEGAVDHLDAAGLIDRTRVGLIGFSFTAWSVKYALTHPNEGYHFAAAAASDGFDGGYFNYIAHGNSASLNQQFEATAGGTPYGDGLHAWLREAPGFNIDKVSTPIRMLPLRAESLLNDWEWFVLLKRMDKPAELVLIEDGTHTLVKPWDRRVASGGNVDWFRFWLLDEVDPTPEKEAQYARWRELRKRQCQNAEFPSNFCATFD
jgi:dipeptidyl aminopeptidase/acylaminoacyl peptidase